MKKAGSKIKREKDNKNRKESGDNNEHRRDTKHRRIEIKKYQEKQKKPTHARRGNSSTASAMGTLNRNTKKVMLQRIHKEAYHTTQETENTNTLSTSRWQRQTIKPNKHKKNNNNTTESLQNTHSTPRPY